MRFPILVVLSLLLASAPAYADPIEEADFDIGDVKTGSGNTAASLPSNNTGNGGNAADDTGPAPEVVTNKPAPRRNPLQGGTAVAVKPAGGDQQNAAAQRPPDPPQLAQQKQQVYQLLDTGNKEGARQVLQQALEQNPQDEDLQTLAKLTQKHEMKVDSKALQARMAALGSLQETAGAGEGGAAAQGAGQAEQPKPMMLASTLGFLAGNPAQTAAVGGTHVPGALQGTLSRATMTKMKMRDYGGAEQDLSEAIGLDDKNWIAYRLRAFVRRYMKKVSEAEADADRALLLNPKDQPSRQIKALLRMDSKDYEGALTEANLAVELNPKNGDALATRAEALKALGRAEEALADLKAAADLDPQFAAMYRQALYERDGGSMPARQRAFGYGAAGLVLLLLALALPIFKRKAETARRAQAPMRAADRTPQAVQGFRILRRIGQGGMGVVYEAHDETLQRRVALKRMRDEIAADPRERRRFMREARLVAGLRHPGIVEIFSLVEQEDALYLVFEFLPGETLDGLVEKRGGKLSPAEALPLARQIAEALDFAHKQGVVHQDLKPSNIVVTAERAKVMDFGIARRVQETLSTMSRAEAIGTPAYMSPEQELGVVTHKADLFAFGVCLYEALAGRAPFGRGGTAMAKVDGSFIPLSRAAGLPETVDLVMQRILSSDPEKRPASAAAFVAELESALLPARA